ncbi:cyclase family protein [Microbacterium soli]|uniref:Cyclase family protein n=1 Tax=Microbacterium soli TaxID=446075 RepID=A0ABP7NCB4_9MICO
MNAAHGAGGVVIDLSLPFDPDVYPSLDLTVTHEADGTRPGGMEFRLGNHIGTHLDAPSHLVPGAATIDQLPLELFVGEGVVLDLPRGENEAVTASDLEGTDMVRAGGDIVFVGTGWDARVGQPEYASHHPYLSEDAAHWLVEHEVRMVGMDVQSVDLGHSLRAEGFRYTSLRILLEAGIPVLHSIARLGEVGTRRCMLAAAPIGFLGADGAPARAYAQY